MLTSEMTPADIAAVTGGGCNNNSWGGNFGEWILIFLLASMFGWGGMGGMGGFGMMGGMGMMWPWMYMNGFGGWGRDCGGGCASQADVRAAVDQQTLISKIDQQTYGMADVYNGLSRDINSNFRNVDNAICNLGYQTQQGFNGVERQLCAMAAEQAKCCCDTQRLVERGFADTNYNMATQFCESRHQASDNTRDLIDNANCNTRAILDAVRKISDDAKDARIAEQDRMILRYQFLESQANQNNVFRAAIDASTAEIIRRTGNECPVPAYVVPNPNCCYGNPVGVGYGNCGSGYGYGYGYGNCA